MENASKRKSDRVTAPTVDQAFQVAPLGTTGTFRLEALNNNTGFVAFGGEPDQSFPDEQAVSAGPNASETTQNAPLYEAGYGLYVEGDLGHFWFAVSVADEGICWQRIR